mmetsp:Transcript_57816/g.183346  ORF Transcript_57816/g.183346 Transcript_57816/m.183346 type:complete len:268 (-) Transcript_57816:1058-1861(-)
MHSRQHRQHRRWRCLGRCERCATAGEGGGGPLTTSPGRGEPGGGRRGRGGRRPPVPGPRRRQARCYGRHGIPGLCGRAEHRPACDRGAGKRRGDCMHMHRGGRRREGRAAVRGRPSRRATRIPDPPRRRRGGRGRDAARSPRLAAPGHAAVGADHRLGGFPRARHGRGERPGDGAASARRARRGRDLGAPGGRGAARARRHGGGHRRDHHGGWPRSAPHPPAGRCRGICDGCPVHGVVHGCSEAPGPLRSAVRRPARALPRPRHHDG